MIFMQRPVQLNSCWKHVESAVCFKMFSCYLGSCYHVSYHNFVRFGIFTVLKIQIVVFCVVASQPRRP